jgi:hypothetical protein
MERVSCHFLSHKIYSSNQAFSLVESVDECLATTSAYYL